ncbi:protein of unknown function [Candidatus Nitrosocosmicus franklandus]|uniref:Uncharacterized protein n=1 Tax=Candidatus Nitrosocosmicus franklandianus TaxID=1798806 RepID=A0A484IDA2_9ARCH|nr:protein of unknown function [Candidatus Nitrosocosmicus franklandus]
MPIKYLLKNLFLFLGEFSTMGIYWTKFDVNSNNCVFTNDLGGSYHSIQKNK